MMSWLNKLMSLIRVGLSKKHDSKFNQIKGKILSITGLATTAALNHVKNKITKISDLFKKADNNNAKIKDNEDKYFTKSDYNKSMGEILHAKVKYTKLVNESDISGFMNNSDLYEKVKKLATKAELKAKQYKTVKLQMYDLSYFLGNFFW